MHRSSSVAIAQTSAFRAGHASYTPPVKGGASGHFLADQ